MPQIPEPPANFEGSKPEWNVHWALTQLKVDFTYQSPQAGGRLELGGAIVDFLIPDLGIAINVHGLFWHYTNVSARMHDQMIQAMMEGWGIHVLYIDEDDALSDPLYYTKEALAGRDHSRMVR